MIEVFVLLKPKVVKIAIYVLSTVLLLIFLYYFNKSTTVSFNKQGGTSYIKYEKAKILRIVDESLEKDESTSNLYNR
ncbi:MAG: hypothetical protein BWY74_03665 [Firmicutes bacterium ADurb.Bin419]|nr:MAG: hypothetical protein BWY74_03665 [Firmicutes bacterium ADurb.Bin419]